MWMLEESDPAGAAKALSLIGAIYVHEKSIRKKKLDGPAKLAHVGRSTSSVGRRATPAAGR